MSVASSDYEHWSDDSKYLSETAIAVPHHDRYNGLHTHLYHPANQEKAPPPEPPKPEQQVTYCYAPPPQQPQPQQIQYMMPYQTMQYAYPPQMVYPAPAYYGYPYQTQGFAPLGFAVYPPAPAAPVPEKKPKELEVKKWQGRTKAEVEEDNMKIAQREGAYDARKVQPIGLKDDQMVWCVEVDGTHTLR